MSELALPRFLGLIIDDGIATGNTAFIFKMGSIMLLINLAGMFCSFGSSFLSARISSEAGSSVRRQLFRKINAWNPRDMDHFGISSIITRVSNDTGQVQNLAMMSLRLMIRAPLMMTGGIIMALSQDVHLSSVLLVSLPLIAIIVFVFGRIGMPLFKANQEKTENLTRIVRENLSGLRVIRAFNKRRQEQERFERANKDLAGIAIKTMRLMGLLMPMIFLFLNTAIIFVLWMGAQRINTGSIAIGSLLAFIQYLSQILFSILMVSMLFITIPQAAVSIKRIQEVMEHEPKIKDSQNPLAVPDDRSIEFNNVSMRYQDAEELALNNINFSLKPGEFIAIIGGTGSGKSTILSLIQRFHDVESGSIRLGGADIRQLKLEELRSLIGYVPQKSFLFSGTIAENTAYGGNGDYIEEALEIAQASGFVGELDMGRDSQVARGGSNFSGGQKQRLTIARALARKPEILLLDDCFSALDARTESRLRAELRNKTKDSLVIMATQRVRSAMHADRILVLDNGRLVDSGSHEELSKKSRVYMELAGTQSGEAFHG